MRLVEELTLIIAESRREISDSRNYDESEVRHEVAETVID